MLQRYKLRLGDGTVLGADLEGLAAWALDDRAMVQSAATGRWEPLREFLARERAAAPTDPGPLEALVADVPPVDFSEHVSEPASIPADLAPSPPAMSAADEEDDPPAYLAFLDPMDPRPPGEPPGIQALAEEPLHRDAAAIPPGEEELPRRPEPRHDELPVIPLKPIENERPGAADVYDGEEVALVAEAPPPTDVVEKLALKAARGFAVSGPLLGRWVDSLGRRLSPSTDKPTPVPTRLYTHAAGWLDGRSHPGGRSLVQERSSPLASLAPPAPSRSSLDENEPTVRSEARQAARQAIVGWAGRVALTGVLVAGVVLAVLRWRSSAPEAIPVGRAALTEAYPNDLAQRQRQALDEATQRLPHLATRTVEQVLATSPTGVLDPAEVFRLAGDAADRGLAALTAEEARELKSIRQQLLGSLPSAERRRVRDYDRAQVRRAASPSDDGEVAALLARGVEALPDERRERLQALLAKAIVYGLVPANKPVSPPR